MIGKFTTSEGVEVKIRPVARRKIALLIAGRKAPKVPTYKVKSVGGVEQEFDHDETTLETIEEKANWATYQLKLRTEEMEFTEKWIALVLSDGVVVELPADDGWKEKQAWQGITVPINPLDISMHYLMTEILRQQNDVSLILDAIIALNSEAAQSRQEAVVAVVDSFQVAPEGEAGIVEPGEGKLDD